MSLNKAYAVNLILTLVFCAFWASWLHADPVVTNVTAAQRTDGSKIVDIWYDLSLTETDSVLVTLTISEDTGENFNIIPAPANLSGDIRFVTQPGNSKHIIWNIGAESRSFDATIFVFKVFAVAVVVNVSFSPPGGAYPSQQYVSLTTATTGATIYYTINGSEPTESSARYSTPINVPTNTTIKAKAFRTGWIASTTTSATYDIPFILVPGGTFTLGRTTGTGGADELPTHSVRLDSFYMGRNEITQGEWQSVMGSNPASGYGVGSNYPVYNVSWYAVLKYCNLRSQNEGLTPVYTIYGVTDPAGWGVVPTTDNVMWNMAICNWNANGYRLPTEAEWEYAARGASNSPDYLYSGSNDINAVAWYNGNNSPNGNKPIGTKASNGLGIYDMSGNAWEWCWDWYGSYSSSSASNPTGAVSGATRVGRGGYWNDDPISCRTAYRSHDYPYFNSHDIGFRVCKGVSSFIFVEGGTFYNGTSDVTLSTYYIDKYEVTQNSYQLVMGLNPSCFAGYPNHPVDYVSWFKAIEYCNRRSTQEGLTPCYSYIDVGTNPDDWPLYGSFYNEAHTSFICNMTANGYRLPTEMEWMFAAKGGNQSLGYTYSGSNSIGNVAWYNVNSNGGTHDVGNLVANELGIYDMSGNVWEWCWDIYDSFPSGPQTNPSGPTSGSYRILRGGSWCQVDSYCSVFYRNYDYAMYQYYHTGFRVCKTTP